MIGTYAEEVCLVAGIDKKKSAVDLDEMNWKGSTKPWERSSLIRPWILM